MDSQEGKANHKRKKKSVLLEKAMAINNIFKERECGTKESHEHKRKFKGKNKKS